MKCGTDDDGGACHDKADAMNSGAPKRHKCQDEKLERDSS